MHTIILSDMHLSEAHEPEPRRPFWMAYKRRILFIDDEIARVLAYFAKNAGDHIELVLNGDIFDFDNVLALPNDAAERRVDWLARLRGLASEEWMSCFKMQVILAAHPGWLAAVRTFLEQGHRVVFVIGNHDLELSWPSVQALVREALGVVDEGDERLVFCEWFYLSGGDTYVSHGHQYDPSSVIDSIDPLISVHGRPRVRLPFGNLAGRYMLNGMGYFNPHAASNYIMSATGYVRFFLRFVVRTQPLLLWTWFWGAIVTLAITLRDHLRPAMRDPLMVEEKVAAIARRANATPAMVRRLRALDAPSMCSRPWAVARELWLDRAILLLCAICAAWQVVLHVNIATPLSPVWGLVPLALLLPPYFAYASKQRSGVWVEPLVDEHRAALIAEITGARRIVCGHTHKPEERPIGAITFFNGGFWSPAFTDPECRERVGTQSFVWIDGARDAALWEWPPGASVPRRLNGAAAACSESDRSGDRRIDGPGDPRERLSA